MSATRAACNCDDLRVVKTRKAIHEAFARLMSQMEYSQITISAISREAMINRNTFYLHYSSKGELLESMCREEITAVCAEAIGGLGEQDIESNLEALTLALLKSLDESVEIEFNVMRNVGLFKLMDMLMDPLESFIHSEQELRGLQEHEHLRSYIACYVGCLLSAFIEWRRNAQREPLEQLADRVHRLMAAGIREAI